MSRAFPPTQNTSLGRQKQQGFGLVEAMIAVMIFSIVLVQAAEFLSFKLNADNAEDIGHRIASYNSAVASYLNAEPARLAALNPPQALPLGVQNGIGWLQAPPCAGATGSVSYLPCGFNDFLPYSLTPYTTTLAPANGGFVTATTNLGWVVSGLNPDRIIGGQIVKSASAYRTTYTTNAETASGFMDYAIDIPTGTITATVNTAALGDRWLRTNGTNAMAGNLNMGGNTVNNANNVNATGTMAAANVQASADVTAGQNVTANTAGAGGDVSIANTGANPINLAEAMQAPRLIRDGDFVEKPTCPADKPSPKIFAMPGMILTGDNTDPITGVSAIASDAGMNWQVSMLVRTVSNPGGIAGNPNAAAMVGTICTN